MTNVETKRYRLARSPHTARYIIQVFNPLYGYWATTEILDDTKGEEIRAKRGFYMEWTENP